MQIVCMHVCPSKGATVPQPAGDWASNKRHGTGTILFATSSIRWSGAWVEDEWTQSWAVAPLSRVAGPGRNRAVAGKRAQLVIEVNVCRVMCAWGRSQNRGQLSRPPSLSCPVLHTFYLKDAPRAYPDD